MPGDLQFHSDPAGTMFWLNSHRIVILSGFKRNCHPGCPSLPRDRSEAKWTCYFCPSDLTAPNKSHHPPFVIPSAAEGPAVRPGSGAKVSVPLVLPQNRHPERSALQIDRVIQRLWRGVEGPRRCLSCPAARSFSTTEPPPGGPATVFPRGSRTKNLLASCSGAYIYAANPVVGLRWLKSFEQHG
jgi:hypothetical protein